MATMNYLTETTVMSLVFHFACHQHSQVEVVDTLEVLEELDDLIVRDDTQIFHCDSENRSFSEIDIEHDEENGHWHHCGEA